VLAENRSLCRRDECDTGIVPVGHSALPASSTFGGRSQHTREERGPG
jgi:hypothetical protein